MDICEPKQWKTIPISELSQSGYPLYGANGKIGFYKEYTHEKPTLMVTCRGATCGQMHISEPRSYINGNAMAFDNIDEKEMNIKYLFYLFRKRGFKDCISGSAQPQITRQGLEKVTIEIHEKDEQDRIVTVLDRADSLRQKRKEQIKLLDDFLKSKFLEMFGDPVRNEKGWDVGRLGDVVEVKSGQVNPLEGKYSDMLCIGGENIESDTGKLINLKKAKDIGAKSGKYLFDKYDILYSKIRPYLNKVAIMDFVGICSADIYPLKSDDNQITREYLFVTLLSKEFLSYASKHSARTSIPKINRDALSEFQIMLPSLDIQKKFSVLFSATESMKNSMNINMRKFDNQLNALMQECFG